MATSPIIAVYRVLGVHYDRENDSYALQIDSKGVDDPTDKRELLLITKEWTKGQRLASFRDREWMVTGTLAKGFVTLWQDDY